MLVVMAYWAWGPEARGEVEGEGERWAAIGSLQ